MPPAVKTCRDCGAALDTSQAPNVRYCARDRERRRALTFFRQGLAILRRMKQTREVEAAGDHVVEAIQELDG